MSEKRALMLTNETQGDKMARYLKYKMIFLYRIVACCIIITAGGTYVWDNLDDNEKEVVQVCQPEEDITIKVVETEVTADSTTLRTEEIIIVEADTNEPMFMGFGGVPLEYEVQEFVDFKCKELGISPLVVFGMMYHESRYQVDAIGDGGKAFGLLQVQPRWHGERMERLGCDNLLDPYENVMVALDYLGELLDRYDGDITKALTAYNRGHYNGEVSRYAQLVMEEAERIGEEG